MNAVASVFTCKFAEHSNLLESWLCKVKERTRELKDLEFMSEYRQRNLGWFPDFLADIVINCSKPSTAADWSIGCSRKKTKKTCIIDIRSCCCKKTVNLILDKLLDIIFNDCTCSPATRFLQGLKFLLFLKETSQITCSVFDRVTPRSTAIAYWILETFPDVCKNFVNIANPHNLSKACIDSKEECLILVGKFG